MEIVAEMEAPCDVEALFSWVDDLDRYPQWLEIVTRSQRLSEPGPEPAWAVELRGRVGPLARSKRLRMVRTRHEPGQIARFERAELDGRNHSSWLLEAAVAPIDEASAHLTMTLRYDGGLFAPVLEKILGDEIERSRHRLIELVAAAQDRADG